jgi:hypothetical protein
MLDQPDPQLAPAVRQLLAALRRHIRRYIWIESAAATVAALGLGFWLALGADWLFEPPPFVRQALLAAVAAAGLFCLAWLAVRRARVRLTDRGMAMLLERRYRDLDDSLLTAVELTDQAASEPTSEPTDGRAGHDRALAVRHEVSERPYGRDMLARTCDEAWRRSRQIDPRSVLNRGPLLRAMGAAAAVVLSIVTLAVASPDTLRFGIERLTAATDEPWPRRTHLAIDGFDNERREVVVARGEDFEVVVRADATPPAVVPRVVELRYRTDDGKQQRQVMRREGIAVPGEDAEQLFRATLNTQASLSFDVVGGDARLSGLRLRVVDSPALSMVLACEYPAYMGRLPADVPVTGIVPLPIGARVAIQARATKNLRQVTIDYEDQRGDPVSKQLALDGGRRFRYTLEPLAGDRTLSFTLLDTDGVQNRAPVRLAISAVPDAAPAVDVRLEGISTAITPRARLPLVGRVEDDYGVSRVWVEYTIDDGDPQPSELAAAADRADVEVDDVLEAKPLALKPGQKLSLGAKAADNRDLPGEELRNIGSGERYLLEVVTPDRLLTLLETRELNLRQRFETIIDEMTETRDSLARLEAVDQIKPAAKANDANAAQEKSAPAEPAVEESAERLTPERIRDRNVLRIERARQSGQKDAEETRGVAVSFDSIRAELINNRVDTEELRIRLKDRIADPLVRLVDTSFNDFDRLMDELKGEMLKGAGPEAARPGIELADAILVEMRQVRDQMLELESFNEAVDLLREIIAEQKRITEQTKKERREKMRRLLEDDE